MDAPANIDRLTAQVARLTSDRDAAYRRIEADQKDINELASGFARLQESLTACEQERDDFKRIVEVWRKRHGGAEDRVRMLESALGVARAWVVMVPNQPEFLVRDVLKQIDAALNPAPPATAELCAHGGGNFWTCQRCYDATNHAPPAETPAPTYKHGIVEIGACLSCIERDRLRAEVGAANEEIARLHASMKLQRDATKQALDDRDAAHAKLGRAIDVLRRLLGEHASAEEFCTIRMQADAILADADGTQAAEAWRELESVYEAAKNLKLIDRWRLERLDAALAAVDARRGGGR